MIYQMFASNDENYCLLINVTIYSRGSIRKLIYDLYINAHAKGLDQGDFILIHKVSIMETYQEAIIDANAERISAEFLRRD